MQAAIPKHAFAGFTSDGSGNRSLAGGTTGNRRFTGDFTGTPSLVGGSDRTACDGGRCMSIAPHARSDPVVGA